LIEFDQAGPILTQQGGQVAMIVPPELRYAKDHEWVRVDGDIATLGITDHAQEQLGDLVYLDLPAVGTAVRQSEKLGEIESVKAVSDVFSPVSGKVTELNEEAVKSPELVNQDPYGRGWLLRLSLSDASEVDKLLTAAQYEELVAQERAE
jgi:glycine cleavage system H protein